MRQYDSTKLLMVFWGLLLLFEIQLFRVSPNYFIAGIIGYVIGCMIISIVTLIQESHIKILQDHNKWLDECMFAQKKENDELKTELTKCQKKK